MKYTSHFRVMWHDTDAERRVSPSRILVYMQETANLQLKDHGISLDSLRDERGLAFLLSAVSMRFFAPLRAYDEIDVETWICDGKGLRFNRCFRVLRNGETVAEASSVWGLMDLNARRLLRAEEFPYDVEKDDPIPDLTPKHLRVPPASEMQDAGTRTIAYSDVDYNLHMNNTRYPDMLVDFLPESLSPVPAPRFLSLSFLREAPLHCPLRVLRSSPSVNSFAFRTLAPDTSTCLEAVLEVIE